MANNFGIIRNLLLNSEGGLPPGQGTFDTERHHSLLNILNGFEEYTLDAEGNILNSNLESVTITGYEEWEVTGKHFSMFYSLEDQFAGKPQNDLLKAGKRLLLTITGLRVKKRGTTFWARTKFCAISSGDHIVGYKMIIYDATHKAVSNHKVRRIRDEYLSLFNNSFVGIFKFSMHDYSVLMMNEKASQLFSEALRNRRGKIDFGNIFDSESDFSYLVTHLRKEKRLDGWEVKLKNEKWVKVSCRYFEQRQFVEGVILDNTLLKKCTDELNRLRHELDQFIYHASHELRGPLVSMLGLINILEHETRDLKGELSSHLRAKVSQLDELLRNVTSIAYNNMHPVQIENIDWDELMRSVVKEIRNGFGSEIRVAIGIDQKHKFANDASRIRAIVRHIVSNSFKYSKPTVKDAWVKVHVDVSELEASISVTDNGIGIGEKYINNIFGMFYKATEYPKGAGLGLYIAKAMVEKIGGSIRVSSAFGHGTVFSIHAPNRYIHSEGLD